MANLTTIASIGMQNDLQRLAVISQNLANVQTSGYKKQLLIGGGVNADFANSINQALPQMKALQNVARQALDASAGTLRFTGESHDVAIEGDGYFELQGAQGLLYTRQGNLRLDQRGRLVSAQGLPVMGVGGELVLNNAPMKIDANGDIHQGERIVGRIKLVHFDDPEAMLAIGDGMYAQGDARFSNANKVGSIRAAYVENSNVNSPQEMVRLVETVRHFEALHKLVAGYDESLEKTIRKLGEF